jgi:hypothetical protein
LLLFELSLLLKVSLRAKNEFTAVDINDGDNITKYVNMLALTLGVKTWVGALAYPAVIIFLDSFDSLVQLIISPSIVFVIL